MTSLLHHTNETDLKKSSVSSFSLMSLCGKQKGVLEGSFPYNYLHATITDVSLLCFMEKKTNKKNKKLTA